MNAVVSILLTDLVPLRDRGVWQGYMNVVATVGTSLGAPLGGFMADTVGWRWSFLAQVPVCFIAFLAVYLVLDIPPPSNSKWWAKIRKIDFLGAFTLLAAVFALLVGLDSGSNLGWSHRFTIASLSITPLLFAIFAYVEVKVAAYPFAPGHIIFHRDLYACYVTHFMSMGAYMAVLFTVPLFFQAVQGVSATVSGAYLVPGMLGVVVASVGGGWLVKRTGRFYWLSVVSFGFSFAASLPMVLAIWFRSSVGEIIGICLLTLGGSSGGTTTLVGIVANVDQKDTAIAVACSYLFRSLGSSIAVSLSSAALQQVLRTQLAARFPNGEEAREIEAKVRQSLDYIKTLTPHQAREVIASYQWATLGAYVPTTILLGIGFLVSFWIKETTLKR